jgi:hypothetical protein
VKSSDLGLLGVSSASLRGFNFVYMRAELDMTIWGQLGPPMWSTGDLCWILYVVVFGRNYAWLDYAQDTLDVSELRFCITRYICVHKVTWWKMWVTHTRT